MTVLVDVAMLELKSTLIPPLYTDAIINGQRTRHISQPHRSDPTDPMYMQHAACARIMCDICIYYMSQAKAYQCPLAFHCRGRGRAQARLTMRIYNI